MDLSEILDMVAIYAKFYEPFDLLDPISKDPDDDKFIACALAANVKVIVSGDSDLLDISGTVWVSRF